MKLTLKYLFTTTAHLTTARMETFYSTWNTQMNSVLSRILAFCVDHVNGISAMSWGHLNAKNAAHTLSCLFLSLLLQELL